VARKTAAGETPPLPARGLAQRDFQVPFGDVFLTFKAAQKVPTDPEFVAFAMRNSLPIEWSAS